MAGFFADLGRWLILEFVPKSDSQVQIMLASRDDIFSDYDPAGLERAFGALFHLREARKVDESERIVYLWEKR